MTWFIKISFLLLSVLVLSTCVEPFNPDIPKYQNILVVDGMITNLEEPYLVELTRSMPYEDVVPEYETGATVLIIDELENITEFPEVSRGKYVSDPSFFRGETGKYYKLYIITAGGDEYESDYVELKSVPEIDTLFYSFEEKETDEPDKFLQGVQIFLSTEDFEKATWYYRWEWIETWEFVTPFVAAARPQLHRCWATDNSGSINIATSKNLSRDIVKNLPLTFVSQASNRLSIMYSILVRQYALSAEAYSFWKSLENINQNMGSLFDPTPRAVYGNIHHVHDPEIPVLGYFQASEVTTKRLFVDRSDLPKDLYVSSGFDYCEVRILENPLLVEVDAMIKNGWIFVDTYVIAGITYYRFTNAQSCYDCTTKGVNRRPEFWPEPVE